MRGPATSTSSAAPTRRARPRCSSPGTRGRSRCWCAGESLRVVDVALPDPAARGDRQRPRPHRHRGRRGAAATSTWSGCVLATTTTATTETVDTEPPVRLHRRRSRAPTGSTAWSCATSAGSCAPGRTCSSTASRPPGWPLDRDPYYLESSVPGVFVAGDVRAAVGEAGRLGRRRGRHGRDARAPVPGGAVSTTRRLSTDGAARAVPVRRPDDEQLELGRRATATSSTYRAGEDGRRPRASRRECFYVLLSGHAQHGAAWSAATRSRPPAPTSAASYSGAIQFYLGDQIEQMYAATVRAVTDCRVPRAAGRGVRARSSAQWFPMAVHLLEGMFLGMPQQRRADRRSGSGCSRWAS